MVVFVIIFWLLTDSAGNGGDYESINDDVVRTRTHEPDGVQAVWAAEPFNSMIIWKSSASCNKCEISLYEPYHQISQSTKRAWTGILIQALSGV